MSNEGASSPSRQLRQSEDVVSSRVGDAGLLVHLQTNRIFELNTTGVRIWELIGEGRTTDEIERVLQSEFDVTPEQLRQEISELVTSLFREGLLDGGGGH